jgi:hypothetical protein
MKNLFLILGLLLASSGFSGGLEEPAKKADAPKVIAPATSMDAVDNSKTVAEDNCKPVGNSVVTNGGDNVGTKVVCSCEAKVCEPAKVVTKYVPGPVRYVTKKVVVPAKAQPPKTVYMDRTVYVEKPAGKGENSGSNSPGGSSSSSSSSSSSGNPTTANFPFGVGVLVGTGPDGVRPYRYGQEYRAEVGRGILMGLDLDYTFKERFFLGGILINNETYMGKLGIRF